VSFREMRLNMQETSKTLKSTLARVLFGRNSERYGKKSTLLRSHHRGWLVWMRKLTNNAESAAPRLIQDGGLTIRSRTEPESVKPASSKRAEDRPSVLDPQSAKRQNIVVSTGINQLYQAGFTKLRVTNHRMHFVLAVLDCFSRYLLVLRVSSKLSQI
jgi:transposase InsO family protein